MSVAAMALSWAVLVLGTMCVFLLVWDDAHAGKYSFFLCGILSFFLSFLSVFLSFFVFLSSFFVPLFLSVCLFQSLIISLLSLFLLFFLFQSVSVFPSQSVLASVQL